MKNSNHKKRFDVGCIKMHHPKNNSAKKPTPKSGFVQGSIFMKEKVRIMHPNLLASAPEGKTLFGFTLIEMLISITILMIFFAVVGQSYISVVNANKTAQQSERVYQDVRNVFDSIGYKIKNGEIDYSFCSTASCAYALSILDSSGQERSIFKYDQTKKELLTQHQIKSGTGAVASWIAQDVDWMPLTSKENPVEDFTFRLFPEKNPYDSVNAADDSTQYQPSVTLSLTIKGHIFRTTYSSRTYGTKALYQ